MADPVTPSRLRASLGAARLAATTRLVIMALRVLSWTWRKDLRALEQVDAYVAQGTPVIAVFWHGQYLSLFAMAGGRAFVVLTSESGRGKVIEGVCRDFGYRPVPVGRGHAHAAQKALEEALHHGPALAAVAVDGPVGPAHQCKAGIVSLASKLGYCLLPLTVRASAKLVLSWRWDRMEIPLPFARVGVEIGPVIMLAKDIEGAELASAQAMVSSAIAQITDVSDKQP